MKRSFIWYFFLLVLLITACQWANQPLGRVSTLINTSTVPEIQPTPTTNSSQTPWLSPQLIPSSTIVPQLATPTTQEDLRVIFHPDGDLYIGDQVSIEVITVGTDSYEDQEVEVWINGGSISKLGPVKFDPFGLEGRWQATFYWAWDTSGLSAGNYNLTFIANPTNFSWTETVTLLPVEMLPDSEQEANWVTTESECCNVFYITGTAAERDIVSLLTMLDIQAENVSEVFNYQIDEPISIVFIPRVLGHGGFANQEVNVSYLDRNYAGSNENIILHHEMVHVVDDHFGGKYQPSLLVEGLAVYLSGGHFKPEPLLRRAAILLDLGWYIPLTDLLEDFYHAQHEISYLEAGALVNYLVDTYGWERFFEFYQQIQAPKNGMDARQSIDHALLGMFEIDFITLESQFMASLRSQPKLSEEVEDLRLTVDYFETIRRYQKAFDSSAYFLTAWMVDSKELRERGIVADFLRHPAELNNIVLETMLSAAGNYLNKAQYFEAGETLHAIQTVLEGFESSNPDPFNQNRLAVDYYQLVMIVNSMGYEAQKIMLNGNEAWVWGSSIDASLSELTLVREGKRWSIVR